MRRRLTISLILATSISLLLPLPAPAGPLLGALQAFLVPGLALVALLWNRGRLRLDDLFISLALSPVLLSLSALAAGRVADGPGTAAAAAWFWYAVLAVSLAAGRRGDAGEQGGAGVRVPRGVVLLSLAYAAVVALSYAANHYLLWRSDAWYHASVTAEILERGTPPGEPWLAGVPIRYMWIYHLFMASWARLSGLEIFPALGALNVAAAAVLPYMVGRFAATLGGGRRTVFLATLLTVAGFESASWVLWPVVLGKALVGEVTGMAEIARTISLPPFDWRIIFYLHPYGTWMANLTDKFLTVTAFGYSLGLFMLAAGISCSRAARAASSAGVFAVMLASAAGAFLFHVITGAVLIAASIGAAVLYLLHARLARRAHPGTRDVLVPAAASLVAAAAVLPYFLSLQGVGGEDAAAVTFVATTALTLLAPLVLLAVPSWRAARRLAGGGEEPAGMARWWILCVLLLCMLVDLPSVNSSKLVFPLFLLSGPFVFAEAVSLARSGGRRRRLFAAWLILLYLPPPLLTLGGFLASRPSGPGERIRAAAFDDPEPFRLIRERTAPDAVIAEPGRTHLMPVFARRRNLASRGGVLDVVGYGGPDVRLYRSLADSLYRPEGIGPQTAAMIRGAGLDLHVLVFAPEAYPETDGGWGLRAHPAFRTVLENDSMALLRADLPRGE